MDKDLFRRDPRGYALALFEDGLNSGELLITALLKYLSHDDVRVMLDANEWSPRFNEDSEDEESEEEAD